MRAVFALIFLSASLATAALSCRVNPDFSGTAYACPDGECPSGFECMAGMCLDNGGNPADSGVVDAAAPDGSADAGDCLCSPDRFADSCLAADLQVLTGTGEPGGQAVCGSTQANANLFFGCTGVPLPASDAVFRFNASMGQTITATLTPLGFDGALTLMTDCGAVCLAVKDDQALGGSEILVAAAPDTGDFFIVVDSATGIGCYDLVVSVTN